jgi:hypothetical protein
MEVDKSGSEKIETKNHRRTENETACGQTRLGGQSESKVAEQQHRCSGEKRKKKMRAGDREGREMATLGEGEEKERKVSPSSPGKHHTEVEVKPHWEAKRKEEENFSLDREETTIKLLRSH